MLDNVQTITQKIPDKQTTWTNENTRQREILKGTILDTIADKV